MTSSTDVVYFHDYFPLKTETLQQDLETVAAEAFFELANAPIVAFRINSKKQRGKEVRVIQDGECQTHTGGIVWETAYLLASYLIQKADGKVKNGLGKVLEVGAGCGMLSMIVSASKLAKLVIMTETTDVLPNLAKNLSHNIKVKEEDCNCCCSEDKISVRRLRWDDHSKDIESCKADNSNDLDPHSFDTIIGTDVIFSTTLVKPLLKTLRVMSHGSSKIYLCVQIRCQDSHDLLLNEAENYGFLVKDCTNDLELIPELEWGLAMDCKLLFLTVKCETKTLAKARKSIKKRKHSNEASNSSKKRS